MSALPTPPARAPRVLLVGPNPFEPRKSMWLFVECLAEGLGAAGFAPTVLRPRFPRLGRLGDGRLAKVALRLVLEGRQLRRAARHAELVHVGDHASAFHLLSGGLAKRRKVVTCHDVFFIASTLAAGAAAPRRERWWQERILRGIGRADRVATISPSTQSALLALTGPRGLAPQTALIPNGLYQSLPATDNLTLGADLKRIDARLEPGRYVLHVGGNFARKNRERVVAVFAGFGPAHGLRLVLAGEEPDPALQRTIERNAIAAHTTVVANAPVTDLARLYQGAFALLFPSRAEGFGLPPIEAQTLGCPVVCSDIVPHRDNLGESALLAGADDSAALTRHLDTLLDPEARAELARRGHANASRFSREAMVASYARLYRELLHAGSP